MDLSNSVIAITGAARGLGFAAAQALGNAGAKLALLDFNGGQLMSSAAALTAQGINCRAFVLDIADEDSVVSCFAEVQTRFEALHGLINCAGIIRDGLLVRRDEVGAIQKLSLNDFSAVINTNLVGAFLCGREAAALMMQSGQGGCIVNITSISQAGNYGQSNYSAAKAGLQAMTVTWAKELAGHGIRAVSLAPGFIRTEILDQMNQTALDKLSQKIPLKKLGQPDQIAHALQFIFENDYLTGRCIELDGGLRF